MSIEKIRERIKMIEENNFELNESSNYLTAQDAETLKNMNQTKAKAALSAVGKADSAYGKALNIAQDHFGRSSVFNIGNGSPAELPTKDQNKVKDLYKLFLKHNLLTNEINHSTLEAQKGYSKINNIIYTNKNKEIQLHYSDLNFTTLTNVYFYLNSIIKKDDPNIQALESDLKAHQINFKKTESNRIIYQIII